MQVVSDSFVSASVASPTQAGLSFSGPLQGARCSATLATPGWTPVVTRAPVSRCTCFCCCPSPRTEQPMGSGVDDIKRARVGKSGVRYPQTSGKGAQGIAEWRPVDATPKHGKTWDAPWCKFAGNALPAPLAPKTPLLSLSCLGCKQSTRGWSWPGLHLKLLGGIDDDDGGVKCQLFLMLAPCCAPAGPLPSTPSEAVRL